MTVFITSDRTEKQINFIVPKIEKKFLEVRTRPTLFYINIVKMFLASTLNQHLTPEEWELDYLTNEVARILNSKGYTARVNGTPVIEVKKD